jgi:small subunit ribosomal protein S16
MSAVIRLTRFGKRHHPVYRVVVTDSRKARDGEFKEQVGFYNPNTATPEVKFETERVLYWLKVGAQPSDTVRSLLKQQGVMDIFHAGRAGRDTASMTATPKPLKAKKKALGPKAKARIEAEKAAKEAPAPAEPAAEAPAEA